MELNSVETVLKKKKEKKSFGEKLLANGETNTVSHKRLISVVCIAVLILLSLLSAFGYSSSECFAYIFAVLAGGESTLTVLEKNGKKVSKARKAIRYRDEEDESKETDEY